MANRVVDRSGQNQLLSVFAHFIANMYFAVVNSISSGFFIWHSMSGFPSEFQYFDFFGTGVITVSFLAPTIMFTQNYFHYASVFKNISEKARRR